MTETAAKHVQKHTQGQAGTWMDTITISNYSIIKNTQTTLRTTIYFKYLKLIIIEN